MYVISRHLKMRNSSLSSNAFQLNHSRNPPKKYIFHKFKSFPTSYKKKRECEKSKYAQEQKTIIESGKLKLEKNQNNISDT